MKLNKDQIEDQLIDVLLTESNRSDHEQALENIEQALDKNPHPVARPVASRGSRHLAVIAASVIFGVLIGYGVSTLKTSDKLSQTTPQPTAAEITKAKEEERHALDEAIRQQEDKVEERRKVLATIVRTKGIIYKGPDSFYGQAGVDSDQDARSALQGDHELDLASNQLKSVETMRNKARDTSIKRGLDAQDYVDAKREFETDQQLLMKMKMAQLGTGDPADPTSTLQPPSQLTPAAPKVAVTQTGTLEAPPAVTRPDLTGRKIDRTKEERQPNTERYAALVDPVWKRPEESPLSTFSIDVDNASYSNIRRMIREGRHIPADAVRIEECINAFNYRYPNPTGDQAFAVHTTLATCPWNESHLLVKVGIKGREIAPEKRPASNLVFLIDVSGSMQNSLKLPLVKESLKLLIHQLDERDSVSYVVYAGREGVVLPPTNMTESGRVKALDALNSLEAGGSTNGGAGIKKAYQMAKENFIPGGVNRVMLATDGDFNVGVTNQQELVKLVKERAASHIYLSILGFGTGNLNDSMLESVSKDGNGNYYYIDSIREGRKVLLEKLSGTLITIAKDVKIQIEFNPQKVGSYRLIGYANRVLENEDFNNDKVDAGDIGAGHTVTAFYEIAPAGTRQPNAGGIDPLKYQKSPEQEQASTAAGTSDEWLTLKLRHKHPEGDLSALQESVLEGPAMRWQDSGSDFQFASAVALFGMKLRAMPEAGEPSWTQVRELAQAGLEDYKNENRAEFVGLLEIMQKRQNR